MIDKKPQNVQIFHAERTDENAAYAEKMAKAIRDRGPFIHPMGTSQPESTKAALSMSDEDRLIFLKSGIDLRAIADFPEVIQRPISYDEFIVYKKMREAPKNSLGDSIESNPGPRKERRDKAIHEYLNTKPAHLDHFQKIMHTFKEEPKPKEKPKKKSLLSRAKEFFKVEEPIKYYYKDGMTLEEWNQYVDTGKYNGK